MEKPPIHVIDDNTVATFLENNGTEVEFVSNRTHWNDEVMGRLEIAVFNSRGRTWGLHYNQCIVQYLQFIREAIRTGNPPFELPENEVLVAASFIDCDSDQTRRKLWQPRLATAITNCARRRFTPMRRRFETGVVPCFNLPAVIKEITELREKVKRVTMRQKRLVSRAYPFESGVKHLGILQQIELLEKPPK